jgi:hypothetical protein
VAEDHPGDLGATGATWPKKPDLAGAEYRSDILDEDGAGEMTHAEPRPPMVAASFGKKAPARFRSCSARSADR